MFRMGQKVRIIKETHQKGVAIGDIFIVFNIKKGNTPVYILKNGIGEYDFYADEIEEVK